MAGRYTNIPTIIDKETGRKRLPTTIYPNIPFSREDIYVRTTPGDRLDLLAYQFYKDVSYWWIIAHANNIGKGGLAIQEGSQLRIPANPQDIQQMFIELNS